MPALDGLRGTAILLVLVSHFVPAGFATPDHGIPRILFKAVEAGWIGVDLFFVLSGFLITGILYRAKGQRRFFLNFYARRTLRIFPLYFAFLTVAVVILPWLFPSSVRLAGWQALSPWFWTYAANLLIARDGWSPLEFQGLDHFWSLAIEEQFYLVWPLAVFLVPRHRLRDLCVVVAVASVTLRVLLVGRDSAMAAYTLMPARMDALAAGGFVALALQDPVSAAFVRRYARMALAGAAVALVSLMVARQTANPEDGIVIIAGFGFLAWFFAALLAVVVSSEGTGFAQTFNRKILRQFGKYSYCLYVIHQPLLLLFPRALPIVHRFVASDAAARVVALGMIFGTCFTVSVASWNYFEAPLLRLRHHFESPDAASADAAAESPPVPPS